MIRYSSLSILLVSLAVKAMAAEPDPSAFATIKDGIHYVDGKPFLTTAAWWGANHWMTDKPDLGLGSQLSLKENQVGGEADFYGQAGYTTAFFTIVGKDIDRNLFWLRECVKRARATGMKVVLHTSTEPPEEVRRKHGWTYVTEEGETKPLLRGFHYDAQKQAEAIREQLEPYTTAIRNEPDIIGYQIGGETWAAISYDNESIARFREFLKEQFSLETLSVRYGGDKEFYKIWEEVFPPIKGGAMDFQKRKLANGRVAHYDWARYNKKVHQDVWVAMVALYNELDGRGRPCSFEFGHGPYTGGGYGLYNWDFPAICDRTRSFSVGPGEFEGGLEESMQILFVKGCGSGPHFQNELGAGSGVVSWLGRSANLRRHIWWSLAMGLDGSHVWTFYNLLGANSEFVGSRNYDPILRENLPSVYFEAVHCNRMINSLGGLLAGSKAPSPVVGILYLEDSNMAGYVPSYKADSQAWLHTLGANGLGDRVAILTEYHVDHDRLGGYKTLIIPTTPRITEARAKKLADYVAGGGALVLMNDTARVDDLCKEYPAFPVGSLAKVAGVRATMLTDKEKQTSQLAVPWEGREIQLDIRERLEMTGARPLAGRDGVPYASVNAFGKGRCIMLVGKPLVTGNDDPTAAFLMSLIRETGVRPAAAMLAEDGQPDTSVWAGHREGPHGKLLILVENGDRAHKLTVSLDPAAMGLDPKSEYQVFECFGEESATVSASNKWAFQTSLEPVGVRVYLITTEATLDSTLPKERRVLISRDDPEQPLVQISKTRAWGGKNDYTVGEALSQERQNVTLETVTAAVAKATVPRDLGNGFLALNLDGYCNASLRQMLKEVDYSAKPLSGALVSGTGARETLPLAPGRNAVGEVPCWVSGRYIEMEPRLLEGIPVGRKVSRISFFHHGIFPYMHESTLGYYRVKYDDGSSTRVPIALFSTLSNLQGQGERAPWNTVVWQSKTTPNRLLRFDWSNPHPEKLVKTVDVVRGGGERFTIWAITAQAN